MIRSALRILFGVFILAALTAGPLPAPTYGLNEGPSMPQGRYDCKKALTELDVEYMRRHNQMVKELNARRAAILDHCMSQGGR